jgi:hypothetical protein
MAHGVQVQLTGSNALGHGREYTAEFWDGFDPQAMDRDLSIGWYEQDNFINPPHFPASSTAALVSGRYKALTTASTSIGQLAGQGGILNFTSAADNDETYLQGGRSHIFASADEDDTFPYHHVGRVSFGCRFALNSVADNVNGMFLGMSGQALATGLLAADSSALVSTFHGIGIQILQADGNAINLVYQENGSALQTPLAGAIVPVADTWYMFEMVFDPWAPPTERMKFWFNGVKSATVLTHAQCVAATFPISTDSVSIPMAPTFLHKLGSAATGNLYLSGYRCWSQIGKAAGNEVCG